MVHAPLKVSPPMLAEETKQMELEAIHHLNKHETDAECKVLDYQAKEGQQLQEEALGPEKQLTKQLEIQ